MEYKHDYSDLPWAVETKAPGVFKIIDGDTALEGLWKRDRENPDKNMWAMDCSARIPTWYRRLTEEEEAQALSDAQLNNISPISSGFWSEDDWKNDWKKRAAERWDAFTTSTTYTSTSDSSDGPFIHWYDPKSNS